MSEPDSQTIVSMQLDDFCLEVALILGRVLNVQASRDGDDQPGAPQPLQARSEDTER